MRISGEIPFKNPEILKRIFELASATKSEQGAKGKELRISGEIPFKNPEILKRIFELASAT
ncbi:hypothetical protein R3X39_26345, partial [Salmonella enterica subsp. enterica serovar Agona]|nr:hypothetical protein [Salmonella enterica subsp. enterica serovar Agona]